MVVIDGSLKKVLKIAGRVVLGLLLTVYVAVAVVNYSIVQSYLGTVAGNYFSKEWGGTVRIGSLGAMPWDHVILHEVLLVAPDGDTILDAGSLRLKFKRFPFIKGDVKEGGRNHGTLELESVYLGRAYYHFVSRLATEPGECPTTNLQFIIDYYNHGMPPEGGEGTFTVNVGRLTLNHVHYKMDLPEVGIWADKSFQEKCRGVIIPHMEFFDICARMRNVHVVNDDVTVKLAWLSTEERSGFKVNNISADVHVSNKGIHVHNLNVETPKSSIRLEADMEYDGWGMNPYEHEVWHRAVIHEGTTVAISDVAYWASVLWGYDAQIEAEGVISGPLSDLNIEELHLAFGSNSRVDIEGELGGIPDMAHSRCDLRRLDVRVAEGDAERLLGKMPVKLSPAVKRIIDDVKYIDLAARVRGSVTEGGTANIDIASGMGNLRADLRGAAMENGKWRVGVEANSDGLGLSLMGSEWLTHMGLAMSAEADIADLGKGIKGIGGEAEMVLVSPVVRGRRLAPVMVNCSLDKGRATVEATSSDTLAMFALRARGDLGDSVRRYDAELDLEKLDAAAFKLMPERFGKVSTVMHATAEGNSLDSLSGNVVMYNTSVGKVKVKDLRLDVESSGEEKHIVLSSDPLNATMTGNFDYEDLPLMVQQMLHEVVPSDLGVTPAVSDDKIADLEDNSVHFSLMWNDGGELLRALGSNVAVARGTRLSGNYNSRELLKMALRSDSVRVGGIVLNDLGVGGRPSAGAYVLNLDAQELAIGKMPLMERLELTLNSNQWRTIAGLNWGEDEGPQSGDLMLRLDSGRVSVIRPYFYVGETRWALDIDDLRVSVAKGFETWGRGISIASDEQRIDAALELRGRDGDNIKLDIDNFDLRKPCELLMQGSNMEADGKIGGRFAMYGLTKTPYFNANLKIDSCVVNRQRLGDVAVVSTWNAELNILNLQLSGDQINAQGWIGLGQKEPELDFSVDFNRLELALLEPLMNTFASRFEGQLNGTLDVRGTTAKPDVTGEAIVENGLMKLDVTGVTYRFDDSITFRNKVIMLDDFVLHDTRGNTAVVDGKIRYNSVQDVVLDLRVHTDNLLLVDKKQGEQFYGTVLASADGTVRGNMEKLKIDVAARTNPGCMLTVPVSDQRQMRAVNYITFVGDEDEEEEANGVQRQKTLPFEITVDLSITPDLRLELPMDFSEVKVGVGATGEGDLHINLDEKIQPQVVGNYEIVDGTMKLSMMSLFEKNFTIENGGNLNFQGNLPDARFDLRAVYSQRANLSTLTGSLSELDNTQKYIQVQNVIAVAGTLREPTLGFDLRLPNADASVEDEVFAYIDRNSERDMINQTMSLLLMGQFYNVSGNSEDNGSTVNNGLSSGYTMMAASVGNMVSDMVQFVNVDVNYKAATELTNEQVDVNISKDWGRWYMESTLGYGGESRELETSARGSAVIDALLGYRISPLVHIFAYNRTNTNDYTRMDLPYKQGVGLKLTKDFDRWDEMLGIRPKNKWKKKKGVK